MRCGRVGDKEMLVASFDTHFTKKPENEKASTWFERFKRRQQHGHDHEVTAGKIEFYFQLDGTFHKIENAFNDEDQDPNMYSFPYPIAEAVPEEWKRGYVEVYKKKCT